MAGDPHRAEDLVQAALIRTHSHWRRVSVIARPDLYVRRAILNEHISSRRSRWAGVLLRPGALEARSSPDPAGASVERSEMLQRLQAVSPRQRAVLILRFYEDMSDTEIAAVLDCSFGTVRGHVSRALATLRESEQRSVQP